MIKAENLSKTFDGVPALTDLNLCVQKGSIYGLIGINGAGKTTVINLLAGILKPDAGYVLMEGEPVYDNPPLKEKIGLISDALWFPAGSSLNSLARVYSKIYRDWDQENFMEMISLFKLDTGKHLRSFSKGMKKQAAFALALAAKPSCLLLDEPIDGLDPLVRKTVWGFIVDQVAERQMSVLISSHNLRELEGICDDIGILHHGRMKLQQDLDAVKHSMHKVQISFGKEGCPKGLTDSLQILHREQKGSVELWVVRGSLQKIREVISASGGTPIVFDILPLTLEEIFIYELGGADYAVKDIVL